MIKERNQGLDLVKIVAMIGVVAIHCHLGRMQETLTTFIISKLAAGYSIPLFFMVSGYLMFQKEKVDYKYCLKKIFKIFRFVASIIFLFWIIQGDWNLDTFYSYFKHFCYCFLQKGGFPVFWYFGSMCILYLILPILKKIIFPSNRRLVLSLLILSLIEFLVFVMNLEFAFEHDYVIQTFRIWNWVFYFLLGVFLHKNKEKIKIAPKMYYVFLLASFHVVFLYFFLEKIKNSDCAYCSWECCLFSVVLFCYIMSLKNIKNRIIEELSKLFLPVYAFHLTVYGYYYKIVNTQFMGEFSSVFDFLMVLFLTLLLSFVIMRIPYINKIFRI